jgi:hypothetical protein
VIDGQLLVGRDHRIDAPHPLRDAEQVHEVLRAADQGGARRMRNGFGKGVRAAVRDKIETGVMRQVAVVEDQSNEAVSWHESLPA